MSYRAMLCDIEPENADFGSQRHCARLPGSSTDPVDRIDLSLLVSMVTAFWSFTAHDGLDGFSHGCIALLVIDTVRCLACGDTY